MGKKISIVIPAYNEEKYIKETLSKLKEIKN
ncbi:MAG: glycosyl transferase, partial [Candidatus Altarchaeum sp. CG_4_9_14_0_8_um_filter_32_206]